MASREYVFATAALREGRLMRAFTSFIAVACLGLVLLAIISQVHPLGPQGVVARGVQGVMAASAVVAAVLWVRHPWPSYRRSVAFVIWGDCAVVIAAATMSTVEARLGATLYVGLVGIFAAFILGRRITLAHCVFGFVAISAIAAWSVVRDGYTTFDLFPYYMPALTWVVAVPLGGVVLIDLGRRAIRRTARSAHFDPLTGLRNRRGLHAAVKLALKRANGPVTVVAAVFDVDGFKALNDTLGHAGGDGVLVTMSEALRAVAGPDDVCARIGGDELVLVAFLDHVSDVDGVVERLRPLTRIQTGADESPVRVSVGVAVEDTEAHFSIDDAISHADAAMYEVKRSGGGELGLALRSATVSTTGAVEARRRAP